ncbi:MAG: penicillin-binding protein 2 [Polyangiales bacterium]
MTLLSPRREVGEFRQRYKWMALGVLLVFAVLLGRLVELQLWRADDYRRISIENITKTLTLAPTRGVIRDMHGRIIATNRPSYSVFITPQLLDPEHDVERVVQLLGLDAAQGAEFRRKLVEVPLRRRTHQIEMFSDISRDQMAALETHSNDLPGVDVVATPRRQYPFGRLSAHTIGYLNEVSAEDLASLRDEGYRVGDVLGRTGIEHAWESVLRGRRGFRRVIVDARGRLQDPRASPRLDRTPMRREPRPGRDLTLTLDMALTQSIERAFRGHPSGAAVVVEIHTGRVRAMFSKPAYDLNEISGHLSTARFRALMNDPFRPLIDKTVYESYFPGSTFKPITALAALGDRIVDPHNHVDCDGAYELGRRKFRCTQAHDDVDMEEALVKSCNVYFYRLAEQVGLDRLQRYARDFGLGARTGVGINSETAGLVPTRSWYRKRYGERFRLGFTLNAAIGQGNTRATLLQIAMAYAAIANGGTLHVPQLVKSVHAANGKVIEAFAPRARRRVKVSSETLDFILRALRGVVDHPDGTAHDAHQAGGVAVAGKTGTAEVSRRRPKQGEDPKRIWYFNRDHAWFAAIAPADDPQLAMVVLVEHGGGGGKNAAPIAMQVLQSYLGPKLAAGPHTRRRVSTQSVGG